ncbi:hypothetical protein [Lentzea sp. NPDC059081]|uniref:hypothetical protein n=1 Tax=Lentzea sp. NPDC059081 TaxID=3346719 RepID=UPI0036B68278
MSERVMAQVVLGATVVLGVTGAALGISFFDGLGTIRTLVVVAFCGLLGIALALVGVHGADAPEPQAFPAPAPAPRPLPALPAPPPAPVSAPAPAPRNDWWNQTSRPVAPPPVQTARKAVPLHDFDAHRAQIAQCPRCAGFELDLRRDDEVCAFTCRNPHCRTEWEWRQGTPWPPTVVRHNLTRATPAEEEHR